MIKPCVICGKHFNSIKNSVYTCDNPECKLARHRQKRDSYYEKKVYEPIQCKHCGDWIAPKRYDQLYCSKKACQQARKNLYDQERDRSEFRECETYKEENNAIREKVLADTIARYETEMQAIKKARLDVECYADTADQAIAKFSKPSSPCEAVDLQQAC